jgi:uncharacterized protein YjiS (DUF1127 family)
MLHCNKAFQLLALRRIFMHNGDGGAIARMPVTGVRVRRGEEFGRVVRGVFERSLSVLGRAQARRAARRELFRLDDRLLKDIGLRRDQVDEFVDAMFRRADTVAAARPTDATQTSDEEPTRVNVGNDGRFRSAA